jgi:hypothetical protein
MTDPTDCNDPSRQVPSAAKGSARRPRVEGGRRHDVKLCLTDEEYAAIAERAADAKVSVPRYLTDAALRRRQVLSQAFVAELAGLRRLTGNLANNINQIARRLNSGGRPDSSIAAAAESVSRVTARLDLALGLAGVPAPPRQEQSAVIPLRDMPFRSHSADPDDHGP